jgi:hypothetical protein
LYSCRIFDRFGQLCGEADSDANSDSQANGNANTCTNSNASANSNPEAVGDPYFDSSRDRDTHPDSGCREKFMSSSGGLWSHILKHEFARKARPVEGDLPPPYAGSELDLHYSLSTVECLQRAPSARRYAD